MEKKQWSSKAEKTLLHVM